MKKLLIATALICLPSLCFALNLGQLRTEVRRHSGDTTNPRIRNTDRYINDLINTGQQNIYTETWVNTKSTSIALVVNTTYYALPSDLIEVLRVTFRDQNIYETSLIKQDADFSNSSWETVGGYPQNYFQNPEFSNQIGMYPYPNSSASTGTINVLYVAASAELVNDTDVPFNGELRWQQYHDLLIYYPVYRIYTTEGNLDKAKYYHDEYDSGLKVMKDRIKIRPNYNPSMGGPNNSR